MLMDIDAFPRGGRPSRRPSVEETPSFFEGFAVTAREPVAKSPKSPKDKLSGQSFEKPRNFRSFGSSSFVPFGDGSVTSGNIAELLDSPSNARRPSLRQRNLQSNTNKLEHYSTQIQTQNTLPKLQNTPQKPQIPSRSLFSNRKTPIQSIPSPNTSFDSWVVVSGFSLKEFGKEFANHIIKYFSQKEFGVVEDVKVFQNSNFIFIKYSNSQEALNAVSKNGEVFPFGVYNMIVSVQLRKRVNNSLKRLIKDECLSVLGTSLATKKVKLEVGQKNHAPSFQSVCSSLTKFTKWLLD